MSEDKLERAINRAGKAQDLLNNELLTEAFAKLDATYIAAWRVTPALQVATREKLWQAVNVVALVRDHLGKVVADGKLAQSELRMRQTPR